MNSLAHFGGWLVGWSISRKLVILLAVKRICVYVRSGFVVELTLHRSQVLRLALESSSGNFHYTTQFE